MPAFHSLLWLIIKANNMWRWSWNRPFSHIGEGGIYRCAFHSHFLQSALLPFSQYYIHQRSVNGKLVG